MSIYTFNAYKAGAELLPPNKRLNRWLHWVWSLLSPLQWLYEAVFVSYKTGSNEADYSAGTYGKGDRVVYLYGVYESLVDANITLPSSSSWVQVSPDFIGTDERILFNGQKIIYEYALNKHFGTTFSSTPGASDIYIDTNAIVTGNFRTGEIEARSSSVGLLASSEPIGEGDVAAVAGYNFTINIPTAVYTALDADATNREKIVRNFADKYCSAGLAYDINPY